MVNELSRSLRHSARVEISVEQAGATGPEDVASRRGKATEEKVRKFL